jgi:hypothetical protein
LQKHSPAVGCNQSQQHFTKSGAIAASKCQGANKPSNASVFSPIASDVGVVIVKTSVKTLKERQTHGAFIATAPEIDQLVLNFDSSPPRSSKTQKQITKLTMMTRQEGSSRPLPPENKGLEPMVNERIITRRKRQQRDQKQEL